MAGPKFSNLAWAKILSSIPSTIICLRSWTVEKLCTLSHLETWKKSLKIWSSSWATLKCMHLSCFYFLFKKITFDFANLVFYCPICKVCGRCMYLWLIARWWLSKGNLLYLSDYINFRHIVAHFFLQYGNKVWGKKKVKNLFDHFGTNIYTNFKQFTSQ